MYVVTVHAGKHLPLFDEVAEIEVDLLDSALGENTDSPGRVVRQGDMPFGTLAHDGGAQFDSGDFDLLFGLGLGRKRHFVRRTFVLGYGSRFTLRILLRAMASA